MAFALRYFVVFLVLSMVSQGLCNCTFDNLEIRTSRTRSMIGEQLEWKVTVYNTCKSCVQKNVTLSCDGFKPFKSVEPWLLLSQGKTCLLIKGNAIPAGGNAHFTYIGAPYIFRSVGSSVDPSCKN